MENIDQKIIKILSELRNAQKEVEKYCIKEDLSSGPNSLHDIYQMALAFDTEKKIYLELNLARAEKFPGRFSAKEIEDIKAEIENLSFNIRAWSNRKFPSQYIE